MARNKLVPPTVLTIAREGLTICGSGSANLLRLPFPPNILKDLNVTDLPALSIQIKAFVESSHLKPSQLVVIMDQDVSFEKTLGETMTIDASEQVQDFIDSVPLSSPSSKIFKINNKYHVVVINRRLYDSVRTVFEELGFTVVAVVPETVLGQIGVGNKFDANACRLVLRKMDFIRENSFVAPIHNASDDTIVGKNKGMAIGLSIGSMVLALGVIGIFSWQVTQTKQAAIARIKTKAAAKAAVTPTPILSLTPSIFSLSTYRVQLENMPATVSSQLKQLGLTNVVDVASEGAREGTIGFLANVPTNIREQVVNIMHNLRPDIKVIQSENTDFDISISW